MRTLTLFFVLFACLAMGQLPEANQKVLNYALSVEGKKVGDGICGTFVEKALYSLNPMWVREYPTHRPGLFEKKQVLYGRILKKGEKALPGDIIEFVRVFEYFSSHAGVIKKVVYEGKYEILDQNSGDRRGKNNKVGSWLFGRDEYPDGKIIIYRPI